MGFGSFDDFDECAELGEVYYWDWCIFTVALSVLLCDEV